MILEELSGVVIEVFIRGVGNLVLGIFGRNVETKGSADDWLVWVVGIGTWVAAGGGVYLLIKWIV